MNHEDELCVVCKKGQLFMHKEDIQFDKITIMRQPLYICDTCDVVFQIKEDYRHTEYLHFMALLRNKHKRG